MRVLHLVLPIASAAARINSWKSNQLQRRRPAPPDGRVDHDHDAEPGAAHAGRELPMAAAQLFEVRHHAFPMRSLRYLSPTPRSTDCGHRLVAVG